MPESASKSPGPVVPLWTVQQVSSYLGVPVDTLYGWRNRGIGPRAHKVGRHLRYDPAEVRRWLSERP